MEKDIMQGLKEKELEMLKHFIDICEKYRLRYFLVEGSCLGAVRHKGFIPWDDDIDVGMPRGDYDKFLSIAQAELPNNFFLQNHCTDKEYPMSFSKIRNSDTTFIEKSLQNCDINHGIYIDVFPLDGFTSNCIKKVFFIIKKYLLSFRISYLFVFEKKTPKKYTFRYFIKKVVKIISKVVYPDIKKAVLKRDEHYRKYKYDASKLVANHSSPYEQKEVMPKEFYGDGIDGVFEGINVKIPKNYDAYLSTLYGDYIELPPEEKRIGHHYHTILDCKKSYREYVNF